jgi:serine/threonine protein kinase
MVYKQPPFAPLTTIIKRLQAIIDPSFSITYPDTDMGKEVVDVIQRCLQRDPKKRPTIPQLLAHPFLTGAKTNGDSLPASVSYDVVRSIVQQAIKANAWRANEDDIAQLLHHQIKNKLRIDSSSLCSIQK